LKKTQIRPPFLLFAVAKDETESSIVAMGLLSEASLNIGSSGRRNTPAHIFSRIGFGYPNRNSAHFGAFAGHAQWQKADSPSVGSRPSIKAVLPILVPVDPLEPNIVSSIWLASFFL
jgi:hypothetical protein